MRKFIETFIERPVFASMVILALVVVGAAAYTGLGVDRLPSVDLPTVSVRTTLPGASPEEAETEIAQEVEEVVNTVDGVEELRSISGQGSAFVIITFRLDRDIDTAAQDVRDKVATVIRSLPEEADPPIISKFDNDSAPVITFALSGERSLRELTEIADKVVKVQLERGKGVGEVNIVGDVERTINVDVDADRLAAYGLPITSVRDAVVRENTEVPGGNVSGPSREQALRTMGRLTNAEAFADIVIAEVNGNPVRLRDVARVEDAHGEQRSVARLNGVPSIGLEIRRQSGANTIEVIEGVKANLAGVINSLPPGVKLEVIRDQSSYINNALHEINTHLVLGSIFACLVVFAFTRSWRSTVIAGVAIPASVISTFAMMYALGFTLNSVTMLALVLMVGIVIDDAIVVLENIFRFVEEKKLTPMEAARQGTQEIALAVLATTLSLAVIFVPVSFMSSISGRFLYQFGITAAVAVLVSLLVSFVLTPTLSARMLGKDAEKAANSHHHAGSRGGFYGYIDRFYTFMLRLVMRHRFATGVFAVLVMLASVPMFRIVQQGYLPQGVDEAEFGIQVEAPQGTSFAAMNDVMRAIEADLMAMPEVRTILASAGGGWVGGVNGGDVHVEIAPHAERYPSFTRFFRGLFRADPMAAFRGNYTQTDVMTKIRGQMRKYAGRGVQVRPRNYPSFNIGGGNFDIDVSITGPDLYELARYSKELVDRANAQGGYVNLDTTLELDKPELRVGIDRERAADLGISGRDIGTALRLMVGGDQEISRFRDPETNESYDVRLRLAEQFRREAEQVPQLLLAGAGGKLVEVRNLAKVEEALGAARIDRLDRSRDSRVRGQLAPGYALADRVQVILAEAEKLNMPPAYKVTVRGAGREFERTYREFIFAFALSIVFMYMILASQYESLVHPVTILLSLPLAVPFALLSLWLAGEQLNLYSALGILVLFGVVKKNAILQIDHMNHLRRDYAMNRYDAVIQGTRDRLRPILMTTLALVAGMLPLWLGTGPGAEERRAVAVVVIGGQTLSLLLTLLVTPVAYTLLDDLGLIIQRKRLAHAHHGPATVAEPVSPVPVGGGGRGVGAVPAVQRSKD
jgi:hydrophobic/amphiphilic exporter-1 (mainly G- bacteria), HAE1 family